MDKAEADARNRYVVQQSIHEAASSDGADYSSSLLKYILNSQGFFYTRYPKSWVVKNVSSQYFFLALFILKGGLGQTN